MEERKPRASVCVARYGMACVARYGMASVCVAPPVDSTLQGAKVVQAVATADVGLVAAHRAIACPVASLRYTHGHEHGKTSNLSPCLFPHSLCFHLVATRYRSDSRPTFNVYKQVGRARIVLAYALRQGALARRRHAASCKFRCQRRTSGCVHVDVAPLTSHDGSTPLA